MFSKLLQFVVISMLLFSSTMRAQEYFVNAKSGLNVRESNELSSEKVAKIPFGVIVEKVADTNETLTVNDNGKKVIGKWVKIKYNNYGYLVSKETTHFEREGFVFDGYLKAIKNKNSPIDTSSITKAQYDKLRLTASKSTYNPKKLTQLNTIKNVLKDRVKWHKEHVFERDDVLKSIRTNSGQELILSQIVAEEVGFDKEYSGYYPEEGILVLVGGHNSDMCYSIKTGETDVTIGNPQYIVPSPNNSYRLNGYFSGQECVSYFFQKKVEGEFVYITEFNWDYDICTFKEFNWISETVFLFSIMDYSNDSVNGKTLYFKGEIIESK